MITTMQSMNGPSADELRHYLSASADESLCEICQATVHAYSKEISSDTKLQLLTLHSKCTLIFFESATWIDLQHALTQYNNTPDNYNPEPINKMHWAAAYGLTDAVCFLLTQNHIDTPDERGKTALHWAV